jgi:hypothetical protein
MSYLELVKQIEGRRETYRRALHLFWQGDQQAHQNLIRLLDDLGVIQAQAIQQEELSRLGEPGC